MVFTGKVSPCEFYSAMDALSVVWRNSHAVRFPAICFTAFKSHQDDLPKMLNLCEHDWEAVI